MKSDFSEVLIPTTGKMIIKEASNHSILKAFLASAFIIAFGLTILRYENKLAELDQRLAVLEIHSIQQEDKDLLRRVELTRNKREVSVPWVKRTGEGDPFVNREYLDYVRSQSQRAREDDDYEFISESESQRGSSRLRSGAAGRRPSTRRINREQIVRNDADETFFTGNEVRPSGLREIYERLPPQTSEPGYQTPSNLETRSASPRENLQYPPVQNLGTGANRVEARVVRFDDSDSETKKKVAVAGHFVADVSNFTTVDNPRLRNSNGIFQIWKAADWMSTGNDFVLDKLDGTVRIGKGGIYHLYAQIHYADEHENSFFVQVNEDALLQCTTNQQSNSCFTAGLAHLKSGDKILIKNLGVDRFSIYKPEKSFFGLVRVGDAQH